MCELANSVHLCARTRKVVLLQGIKKYWDWVYTLLILTSALDGSEEAQNTTPLIDSTNIRLLPIRVLAHTLKLHKEVSDVKRQWLIVLKPRKVAHFYSRTKVFLMLNHHQFHFVEMRADLLHSIRSVFHEQSATKIVCLYPPQVMHWQVGVLIFVKQKY
jgi:hypothetical protein